MGERVGSPLEIVKVFIVTQKRSATKPHAV
jgi:hypothetical protein